MAATDGLWFTGQDGLERMSTDGTVSLVVPSDKGPTSGGSGYPLATGPDGSVWTCWTSYGFSGNADDSHSYGCRGGELLRVFHSGGYQVVDTPPPSCTMGHSTEYQNDVAMAAAPDGTMWLLNQFPYIDRIDASNQVNGFCPQAGFEEASPSFGSDSALWFIDLGDPTPDALQRIDTSGNESYYSVGYGRIASLASGPDFEMWFTTSDPEGLSHGAIDAITSTGVVSTYALPDGVIPEAIVSGPGGLWFTAGGIGGRLGYGVGKLDPSTSTVLYYRLDHVAPGCDLGYGGYTPRLVVGPDQALWFEVNLKPNCRGLVRITPSTPGDLTPAPVTVAVAHPITIPRPVRQSWSRTKAEAEVSTRLLGLWDEEFTVLKLAMAAGDPELAPELLLPNGQDASEFLLEKTLDEIAKDPPDFAYNRVASVQTPGAVAAARRVPPSPRRAWSQLNANVRSITRSLAALLSSVQRLEGAAAASNCHAFKRQYTVAKRAASTARIYISRNAGDIDALRRELGKRRARRLEISQAQFQQTQVAIARSGLPPSITAGLEHSGMTAADISSLVRLIVTAKPQAVSLFGALSLTTRTLKQISQPLATLAHVRLGAKCSSPRRRLHSSRGAALP